MGGGQGYICGWGWRGWKEREFPLTKQKTGMGDLLSREEEKQLDTRKKRSRIGHMPLASSPPVPWPTAEDLSARVPTSLEAVRLGSETRVSEG